MQPEPELTPETMRHAEAMAAEPIPPTIPERIPVNDWWCYRFQPVSGRYRGETTIGNSRYEIDLRIDVDVRHANSPVLNAISADVHQKYGFRWGGRDIAWSVYRYSWVMTDPTIDWSRCNVEIVGDLTFFGSTGSAWLPHSATIDIDWAWGRIRSATASISPSFGDGATYDCRKVSNAFRDLALEVDYCDSVNEAPTLPSYNTTWHSKRPSDTPERVLTIEESYREAGIEVTINPDHTVIDDSHPDFTTWSPAELHDAMETHYSRHPGTWPKWHQWCLLAGSYDSAGTGGIMFDAAAAYGGSGDAPERQGSAVFKNHSWWNDLVPDTPSNPTEAAAMRKFLHTYVHEMGHAFNFVHSWNKSRPDSLSWMNYDWRYENRNGTDSYWNNFEFRFDDQELAHLRHGDRKAVIPGGDPWATGLHASDPDAGSEVLAVVDGDIPLELLLRPKEYYEFLEPVVVEARLRNLSDLPIEVDTRLEPEHGNVAYFIRTPRGETLTYGPVLCLFGDAELERLEPRPEGQTRGPDRRSKPIRLGYGSEGFYFSEPGDYQVRAVYHEPGGMIVPSNVATVRVGRPFSRDEERLASKVYDRHAGLALYLGGSRSEHLEGGREALVEVCERFPEGKAAAEIASVLATDLSEPFFTLNDKNKLVETGKADRPTALAYADQTIAAHTADHDTMSNLKLGEAVKLKAGLLAESRKKAEARKQITAVCKTLEANHVNQSVLDEMADFAKSL